MPVPAELTPQALHQGHGVRSEDHAIRLFGPRLEDAGGRGGDDGATGLRERVGHGEEQRGLATSADQMDVAPVEEPEGLKDGARASVAHEPPRSRARCR